MGMQQIILIVLTVIIVGISIVVGFAMYKEHAQNANRIAVLHDINKLIASAIAYHKTPLNQGGGGNNFDVGGLYMSWSLPMSTGSPQYCLTENGGIRVAVSNTGQRLVFNAYGTEIGNDGTSVVMVRVRLNNPRATPLVRIIN